MSAAPQHPRDDDPDQPSGRSTSGGRRGGRILIPGIFVGTILLLMLFILLVSQIGQ